MSEIATIEPETTEVTTPANAVMTPAEMLSKAVDQGASVDMLEKLMTLQERWDEAQAKKAFTHAMSAAKKEFPQILKKQHVSYTNKNGEQTEYDHEGLSDITDAVDPILTKHGLSYSWETSIEQGMVFVDCVVEHEDGHSKKNQLCAGRDESGGKNNIQALGSTLTYLQRYTLKAALGLSAAHDDDGQGANETITEEQFKTLSDLADEGQADVLKLCQFLKVNALRNLPSSQYAEAERRLKLKIAQKAQEEAESNE